MKDIYRPKINEKNFYSVRRYNSFISNFIDKRIWGQKKKFHGGDWTKKEVNAKLGTRAEAEFRFKESYMAEHLTTMDPGHMYYYVNSPFTNSHLLNADIDVKDEYKLLPFKELKEERQQIIRDISVFFPSCFADTGSSGLSLNFYFIAHIDYQEGADLYEYSKICKIEQELLSLLLKEYFKTQNYTFYHFDDIKGRTAGWQTISDHFQIYYFGKLSKLPLPDTFDDFKLLYSLQSFDIKSYVYSLFSYFIDHAHSLSDSFRSFIQSYIQLNVSGPSPSTLLYDYQHNAVPPASHVLLVISTILSPQDQEYTENKGINDEDNENTIENTSRETAQTISKDTTENIKEETDAIKRGRNYAFHLFTLTYSMSQRRPTFEEYRENYRQYAGTGEEDAGDIKRLRGTYDYMVDYFDPEKVHGRLYTVGEFVDDIKISLSEFTLGMIRKTTSSDNRKIRYEDIDVAAGFFFISLALRMRQINIAKMDNNSWMDITDDSFSLAQNSMTNFFKSLKNLSLYDRACNRSRAKALKEILLHMGWIECIDSSYVRPYRDKYGKKITGRGRRYVMTEKFPKYNLFKNIVGEENIKQWKDNTIDRKNKKAG